MKDVYAIMRVNNGMPVLEGLYEDYETAKRVGCALCKIDGITRTLQAFHDYNINSSTLVAEHYYLNYEKMQKAGVQNPCDLLDSQTKHHI